MLSCGADGHLLQVIRGLLFSISTSDNPASKDLNYEFNLVLQVEKWSVCLVQFPFVSYHNVMLMLWLG